MPSASSPLGNNPTSPLRGEGGARESKCVCPVFPDNVRAVTPPSPLVEHHSRLCQPQAASEEDSADATLTRRRRRRHRRRQSQAARSRRNPAPAATVPARRSAIGSITKETSRSRLAVTSASSLGSGAMPTTSKGSHRCPAPTRPSSGAACGAPTSRRATPTWTSNSSRARAAEFVTVTQRPAAQTPAFTGHQIASYSRCMLLPKGIVKQAFFSFSFLPSFFCPSAPPQPRFAPQAPSSFSTAQIQTPLP